jgi:hypothetical protein
MLKKIRQRLITKKILQPPKAVDETSCKLVSSRGLLKSCDVYPRYPKSGFPRVRDLSVFRLRDRSIIYVQNSAIGDFYKNYFPKIKNSFVIVSGDADDTMPLDKLTEDEFRTLMNDKRCLHWFSQNAAFAEHPKFSIIPAGLDYHTLTYSHRKHSWGDWALPVEQEKRLLSIRERARPTEQRIVKGYSTFHFFMSGKYGYDRVDAIVDIPKDAMFYERIPVDRETTWKNQSQYAFVVSPLTNGLDAHRTWEALALGCIPIVKTSPLMPLFEELPVLIVNEWSEVTRHRLQIFLDEYKKRKSEYNYDKLTLAYWVNKIRSTANRPSS